MPTTATPRFATVAVVAALLLLAAACGGGGGNDPTIGNEGDGGSPAAESTPTDSETTPTETTDTGVAAAECPSGLPLPEGTDKQGAVSVDSSTVEIEAGDQFFKPTCLTDVPQGTLTLTVSNTGQALHNIQIEGQNIDKDIEAGESVTVDVEVGSEPVVLSCKYHSGLGMHGVIVPQA